MALVSPDVQCHALPSDVTQGDLTRPETLPAALVGVHTVIDCATGRPEEPIRTVSEGTRSGDDANTSQVSMRMTCDLRSILRVLNR